MIIRPLHNVLWNIFLAIVPAVLALIVFKGVRQERREGRVRWHIWVPVLFVWLVFLPNTCYLLTEWRHYLADAPRTPEFRLRGLQNSTDLYQFLAMTLFYVVYSGTGVVCYFLAIYPLDMLFKPPWLVRASFFMLCSIGVYLGLVDRLNSWQVVLSDHQIFDNLERAFHKPAILLLIVIFGLFLWAMYGIFSLMMDGVRLRYRSIKRI